MVLEMGRIFHGRLQHRARHLYGLYLKPAFDIVAVVAWLIYLLLSIIYIYIYEVFSPSVGEL